MVKFQKKESVRAFLEAVDGLPYLPVDTLGIEIQAAVNALYSAHTNYNNFANEFGPAQRLLALIPANGAIPAV